MKQFCNLIPGHIVSNLAKEHGLEARCRTLTPWSHVVTLLHARLTHAIGLNDVCDALQMNKSALSTIRGAVPPTRFAGRSAHAMPGLHAWLVAQLHPLVHCGRAVLWRRWHLFTLLKSYGTAKPPGRMCVTPELAYLPEFSSLLWDSHLFTSRNHHSPSTKNRNRPYETRNENLNKIGR